MYYYTRIHTYEHKVLDLRHVELVYGSSFFKSIETGGNVSKALVGGTSHWQEQLVGSMCFGGPVGFMVLLPISCMYPE